MNIPHNHVVQKKTVVDSVMDAIIADIVGGRFPPGTKLPNEYELITELNVSRNSLREAVKIMSAMGILEIKHGDGTYVCNQVGPSSLDNVVYGMISSMSSSKELLELRQIFDEAIVRLAIEKITPEEIDHLQQNINAMKKALSEDDSLRASELDYQFHQDIITSCKNALFIRVAQGLYTIFKNSMSQTINLEKLDNQAPEFHQNILECIKSRDYARVHDVVADSLISWRHQV